MYGIAVRILILLLLVGSCDKPGSQLQAFSPVSTMEDLKRKNALLQTDENSPTAGRSSDFFITNGLQQLSVIFPKTDYLPFYYQDKSSDQFLGSAVEAVYTIATQLGATVTVQRLGDSPEEAIQLFLSQDHDLLVLPPLPFQAWNLNMSASIPYATVADGLLVNRTKSAQLQKASLGNQDYFKTTTASIGIVEASPESQRVKSNLPTAKIVQFSTLDAALDAVLKGDILCLYLNEAQIYNFLTEDPARSVFLEYHDLEDADYQARFAVPSESRQLLDFVNIFLADFMLRSSGEADIETLVQRYKKGREENP